LGRSVEQPLQAASPTQRGTGEKNDKGKQIEEAKKKNEKVKDAVQAKEDGGKKTKKRRLPTGGPEEGAQAAQKKVKVEEKADSELVEAGPRHKRKRGGEDELPNRPSSRCHDVAKRKGKRQQLRNVAGNEEDARVRKEFERGLALIKGGQADNAKDDPELAYEKYVRGLQCLLQLDKAHPCVTAAQRRIARYVDEAEKLKEELEAMRGQGCSGEQAGRHRHRRGHLCSSQDDRCHDESRDDDAVALLPRAKSSGASLHASVAGADAGEKKVRHGRRPRVRLVPRSVESASPSQS